MRTDFVHDNSSITSRFKDCPTMPCASDERMPVAKISALLYLPDHARDQLERALRIQALSPGWRGSFEALLESQKRQGSSGIAGLAPAAAARPAAPGFQRLAVTAIDQESADVISLAMARADGHPLPAALPGQYVVLRLQPSAGSPRLFRSYSLSGAVSMERYRIRVKIEPNGVGGNYPRELSPVTLRLRLRAFT